MLLEPLEATKKTPTASPLESSKLMNSSLLVSPASIPALKPKAPPNNTAPTSRASIAVAPPRPSQAPPSTNSTNHSLSAFSPRLSAVSPRSSTTVTSPYHNPLFTNPVPPSSSPSPRITNTDYIELRHANSAPLQPPTVKSPPLSPRLKKLPEALNRNPNHTPQSHIKANSDVPSVKVQTPLSVPSNDASVNSATTPRRPQSTSLDRGHVEMEKSLSAFETTDETKSPPS